MNQSVDSESLTRASKEGEQRAAKALSVLAKREVNVTTVAAQKVDASTAADSLNKVEGHSVVVYTTVISGMEGACVMSLNREDALNLVDLFNNRPQNSTVVMQEIDRSTIKETLNILSNAYITEVANMMGTTVLLSVPKITTKEKLDEIAQMGQAENQSQVLLFETSLSVAGVDFQLELYFFFVTI